MEANKSECEKCIRIAQNAIASKDPQFHSYYRLFLTEDANKPPQPLVRVYPESSSIESSDRQQTRKAKRKAIVAFTLAFPIILYSVMVHLFDYPKVSNVFGFDINYLCC